MTSLVLPGEVVSSPCYLRATFLYLVFWLLGESVFLVFCGFCVHKVLLRVFPVSYVSLGAVTVNSQIALKIHFFPYLNLFHPGIPVEFKHGHTCGSRLSRGIEFGF